MLFELRKLPVRKIKRWMPRRIRSSGSQEVRLNRNLQLAFQKLVLNCLLRPRVLVEILFRQATWLALSSDWLVVHRTKHAMHTEHGFQVFLMQRRHSVPGDGNRSARHHTGEPEHTDNHQASHGHCSVNSHHWLCSWVRGLEYILWG